MVYDGDFINITQAAFPHPYQHFNHLRVSDNRNLLNLFPQLRLSKLLFPLGAGLDLSHEETAHAVALRLLTNAARTAFPALATTSLRLAVAELLSVPLPYQLQRYTPALSDVVHFITLLTKWADPGQRLDVVAEHFHLLLSHAPTLVSWVEGTTRPLFRARELLGIVVGASAPADCDGLGALDEALEGLADYWGAGRSADENCTYLLQRLRSTRRAGSDVAGPSGTARAEDGVQSGDHYAKQLNDLSFELEKHFSAANAGPFGAIELIYESQATPAIRWLHGKGVKITALPAIFAASCSGLPSQLQAYLVDCVLHDDDGQADPDMDEVVESTFYQVEKGKSVPLLRTFYDLYTSGKFLSIDWDRDFVLPILLTMDPAAQYMTPAAVYADPDRRAYHKCYVGRLLHAIGKPQDSPASLAAAYAIWEPPLARCKQGGADLAADCIEEVGKLMTAVWSSAEMLTSDAFRLGTPWDKCLFDVGNLRALERFNTFVGDSAQVRRLAKRFKRSMQSPPQVTAGISGGGTSASAMTSARALDFSTAIVPSSGKGKQPRALPAPQPVGGRVPNIDRDGDWAAHNWGNAKQFHLPNCCQLFADAGYADQCVLVVTSTAGSLQHAAAWCEKGHPVECPQHALYHKYAALAMADKMVDGVHLRANPNKQARKPTAAATGGRAAGKHTTRTPPFRGRPAPRNN